MNRRSTKFVAVFGRFVGRYAVTCDVFRNDARDEEVQQVIFAAGFCAAAAHLESAKGMTANDRASARAVDVNIAGFQLRFDTLDVGRAAREKAASQRVIGAVGDFDRFIEVTHLDHTEHWPENLLARDPHAWFHPGENRRRNEITVWWNAFCLVGECRLAFADLDVIQNAPVSGLINYRSDYDARFFRIADTHAGGGTDQTFHDPVVVFFENDQPRERGTFLALKTERGINRIDNRFIQIGVRIDD